MKIKKLFILRHASYGNSNDKDPALSDNGRHQARMLAKSIEHKLNGESATVWTSTAARAFMTAEIIADILSVETEAFEKLWSDNWHRYDFPWLLEQLENFEGDNLVIISHLEYVHDFPQVLHFHGNSAGYAEGVLIENERCVNFR